MFYKTVLCDTIIMFICWLEYIGTVIQMKVRYIFNFICSKRIQTFRHKVYFGFSFTKYTFIVIKCNFFSIYWFYTDFL